MLKKLLAIILILLGVVAVVVGVWGLSLQGAELPEWVTDFVDKALVYVQDGKNLIDETLADNTGRTTNEYLFELSNGEIDLNNKLAVWYFIYQNAMSIILAGVVGVETGLLLWIAGRRR